MKKKYFFGILLSLFLLCGGVFLLTLNSFSNFNGNQNLDNENITLAYNNELYFDNVYGYPTAGVSFKIEIGYADQNGNFRENTGTCDISATTAPSTSTKLIDINPANWGSYRYRKCHFSSFDVENIGDTVTRSKYKDGLYLLYNEKKAQIVWRVDYDDSNETDEGTADFYNFSKIGDRVYSDTGATWHITIYWLVGIYLAPHPGSGGSTYCVYDTYKQDLTSSITLPTRNGYDFQGYYTTDGTQVINSAGQWTGKWNQSSVRPTVLDAHWTINSYKSDVNFYDPNNQQQGGTFDLYRKINGKEELLDDDANNEVGGEEWLQYNGQWILRDIHPNTGTHITSVSLSGGGTISVTGTAPNITEIIYTANQTYAPKPDWDGTVNIYTAWNTYKVRYNANGGSGTMTDQSFVYNTAQNLNLNTFTRAGYYFTGWNGNGTNYINGQSVINLTTTHNSTIDFYAQWEPNTYSVLLDQNGGTGGTASASVTYGLAMPSITVPKCTGYTFLGYYDTNGKQYYTPSGTSANIWDKAENNVTLYARWQANTYTTTFHDGEGAVTNFADMMITNYNYTYSNNEYSYTVNGVTITYENGTGTLTLNGTPTNAFTIFINTDLSFKQNEQYSVKYTKQEGNMTGETSGCFVLEICDENWANLSTRNHLDFQMNASSGEAKLTVNESGATYGKGLRLWFWFNTNATPARVFNNFKIKITLEKLGENQSVIKTGKVTYDSQLRGVSIPSKIGHTFNGYYNSQSGGKQYYKATGVAITKTWKETNNITLYARWTPHSYTIVFNGNDSTSGSTSSKKATYDSNVVLSPNGFKRTGYVFTGWNTKSDGKGKSYLDKATVKNLTSVDGATITLYAQWEETWANHTSSSLETTEINGVTYNVIASAEDLAYLSKQSISSTLLGKYIQTADIDLSDYTWLPIGSEHAFCGEYLGQGHKITGLHTSDAKNAKGVYLQTYGGLFGKLGENSTTDASANIVGVYITDCLVYGQYSGAIAGFSDVDSVNIAGFSDVDSVNIEACIEACILENVKIYGNTTASFVGSSSDGQIKDCLLISSNISTANATTCGFYTGTMTVNSSYYMNGTTPTQFYTSGASSDYSNWVTGVFKYPLPKALIWYPGA